MRDDVIDIALDELTNELFNIRCTGGNGSYADKLVTEMKLDGQVHDYAERLMAGALARCALRYGGHDR